ncbi:hypothetical protein HNQ91_001679 [Filimonas zeae]|uniref:Uncharacterized protein n=1 Tax=Filimonas zeae TaxID=1737353 RepID=A0A917IZ42_9BACT|nr:hypothetical protein [Filimonas zeae]MDR6338628.1 hypothetical protein [Filimonas zeae]GGH67325.1 hypothetical protein GCM10011379_22480 [Filimonas zeae]
MANPKRKGRAALRLSNAGMFYRRKAAHYSSLSEIEDRQDKQFFTAIARSAAANAINENKALNIPVVVVEDGWVVRKSNNGEVEKISEIEQRTAAIKKRMLTKGTVLYVKKG